MRVTKILVEDDHARHIQGEKNGRSYSFHTQQCVVFFEGKEGGRQAEVTLPPSREGQPYPIGQYLPVQDFYINRKGNLAAGVNMQPMPATTSKAAAA